MSSQELDRLLETLKIDPDDLNTDVDTRMCEFDEGLNETLQNPKWSGSEHEQDISAGDESALSGSNVAQPRKLAKSPGIMIKSPVGRGATLAAKRGKDDPKFTVAAYGYEEELKGRSHFCFDTSDEIDIGTHETTGNKVVKIYKQTLKELEEWLRDLLTKDNYVHVHHCIKTFLRVHIEEEKPLPVKIVRRLG
jgi:hypothetical protein